MEDTEILYARVDLKKGSCKGCKFACKLSENVRPSDCPLHKFELPKCMECGKLHQAYSLKVGIWLSIAETKEVLCFSCANLRMQKIKKRVLKLEDLNKLAPINEHFFNLKQRMPQEQKIHFLHHAKDPYSDKISLNCGVKSYMGQFTTKVWKHVTCKQCLRFKK